MKMTAPNASVHVTCHEKNEIVKRVTNVPAEQRVDCNAHTVSFSALNGICNLLWMGIWRSSSKEVQPVPHQPVPPTWSPISTALLRQCKRTSAITECSERLPWPWELCVLKVILSSRHTAHHMGIEWCVIDNVNSACHVELTLVSILKNHNHNQRFCQSRPACSQWRHDSQCMLQLSPMFTECGEATSSVQPATCQTFMLSNWTTWHDQILYFKFLI